MASHICMASSLFPAAASGFFPAAPNPHNGSSRSPPLTISTNRSHIDTARLRDLLHASGHSCHRFPDLGADGRPEPVDLGKLRTALAHSAVVVSVFCRSSSMDVDRGRGGIPGFAGFEELLERAAPGPGSELVGFGRAVSDGALTASIHDVVVIPSLQRLGVGRKIVQRIVSDLQSTMVTALHSPPAPSSGTGMKCIWTHCSSNILFNTGFSLAEAHMIFLPCVPKRRGYFLEHAVSVTIL